MRVVHMPKYVGDEDQLNVLADIFNALDYHACHGTWSVTSDQDDVVITIHDIRGEEIAVIHKAHIDDEKATLHIQNV